MSRPTTRAAAAIVLVALLALATGCSDSKDGADSTTTAPTPTTKPEITDEEIVDNLNDKVGPSLEAAFDAKTAKCILGILEDGGVGKLSADEVVPSYQKKCGVSATEVTGAITAGALVQQGATKEQAACVREAVGKLTYDQINDLGEIGTNKLYEDCGIDPATLTGG